MEGIKILLVEDDHNFGDVLKSYLEMHDFEVTLAPNGEVGLKMFKEKPVDLCILDVMMPKMDGFTLAKEIRKIDQKVPIIFLTAKTMKEDIVAGFKLGADDYVSKPFNSEELLVRIQAVLKRTIAEAEFGEDPKEYDFGNYHFHFPTRVLTFKGSLNGKEDQKIKLSPKEAELLKLFCKNINQVLSRSNALKEIWGEDSYFTARSMDVFITKLRKHLKIDDSVEIVNIHGNGFQLLEKEKA
ncbi:MAG: DNA-binding response regulator [Saprospirales bacterium]|nr:MAG: DNA-binding response regulator [Saprospirales bacterium]